MSVDSTNKLRVALGTDHAGFTHKEAVKEMLHTLGHETKDFGTFSEDSVEIVRTMRRVVEGDLSPVEAVKSYHNHLHKKGLLPARSLEQDLRVTDPILVPESK